MEIKAVVSEDNGEISCSVEETNRIRKLLGLKPLKITEKSSEADAVNNFREKQIIQDRNKEEQDIRARLESAKNRRLLNSKLQGSGLGEVASISKNSTDDTALLSAADWVKRSRNKAVLDTTSVKVSEKKPVSDHYDSTHLKGLKINHSTNAFDDLNGTNDFRNVNEGVILTLADTSILSKDGRGRALNHTLDEDHMDILENVNLKEADLRAEREKKAKRMKQPLYGGYDDDEFEELNPFHTNMTNVNKAKKILAHYDLDKQVNKHEILIGDGGQLQSNGGNSTAAKANTISFDEDEEHEPVVVDNLQISKREVADYYTQAEYDTQFNKPKKTKRVKKLKQKESVLDEDDDGIAEAKEVKYDMDIIEEQPSSSSDRGSRKSVSNSVGTKPMSTMAVDSLENYYKAIASAQEKNLKTFSHVQSSSATQANVPSVSFISINNPAAEVTPGNSEDHRMVVVDGSNEGEAGPDDDDAVDADGRRKDGVLIFNDTTEFTTRLRARLNEKARVKAEVAVKDQERMELTKGNNMEGDEEGGMEGNGYDSDAMVDVDQEEEDGGVSEDNQLAFLHQQPLVSQGMAATLALLKQSSHVNESESLIGRARDKRSVDPSAPLESDANQQFDVKIEYRDKLGRKLTQKDAFRQICYKFHGYGPSKKKLEKRAKDVEIMHKNKTSDLSVSGTMKSLTQTQEASGKAHVVIQGGVSGNAADLLHNMSANKKMKLTK